MNDLGGIKAVPEKPDLTNVTTRTLFMTIRRKTRVRRSNHAVLYECDFLVPALLIPGNPLQVLSLSIQRMKIRHHQPHISRTYPRTDTLNPSPHNLNIVLITRTPNTYSSNTLPINPNRHSSRHSSNLAPTRNRQLPLNRSRQLSNISPKHPNVR